MLSKWQELGGSRVGLYAIYGAEHTSIISSSRASQNCKARELEIAPDIPGGAEHVPPMFQSKGPALMSGASQNNQLLEEWNQEN